ncbi:MAG: peptidyl-prolyl cis-trans isomerase [Treponema sp.]|jgi:parvulin-like peptidyl-prolyl isomerase|nr:peptidyl-prolyl cis-trans isomerase [Treponema sp.]
MKRFITFVFGFSLFGATAFAQSDLQPAAIVRLTRSEPITVKQLKTEVERLEKGSRRTLSEQERRQVLDVMINEKLAIQAAERDRIAVSEGEVTQQVQQLRTGMIQTLGRQPTEEEFTIAVMNETGLDVPSFREQIRRQLIVQKYLMAQKKSILESFQVPTEDEILNTYTLAKAQFVRPDTVRFSMIQVPFNADGSDRSRARELADQLNRDIGNNPTRFDEAVMRAQAQGSGYRAGDGGYLPRNMQAQQAVGQEFMDTAFTLRQGEVSKLIEGPRGFQIVKITEKYEQKNLDLDDLIQPGSRVTVRDYIGNMMLQERQQAVIEKATEELVTELRRGNSFQVFENNIRW